MTYNVVDKMNNKEVLRKVNEMKDIYCGLLVHSVASIHFFFGGGDLSGGRLT